MNLETKLLSIRRIGIFIITLSFLSSSNRVGGGGFVKISKGWNKQETYLARLRFNQGIPPLFFGMTKWGFYRRNEVRRTDVMFQVLLLIDSQA